MALVCFLFLSIIIGFVAGTNTGVIVLSVGVMLTLSCLLSVILNERSHHHYRANLRAETQAEIEKAQAAMIEARAVALSASLQPVAPTARLMEPMPHRDERRMFFNGVEQPLQSEDADDEPYARDDDLLAPMHTTITGESQADRAVRIRNLARAIYSHCRDAEPTQSNIRHRIGQTPGGLLRSNQDITDALNELSAAGMVSESVGAGVARRWLRRPVHVGQ